jgi:hypothetical protein
MQVDGKTPIVRRVVVFAVLYLSVLGTIRILSPVDAWRDEGKVRGARARSQSDRPQPVIAIALLCLCFDRRIIHETAAAVRPSANNCSTGKRMGTASCASFVVGCAVWSTNALHRPPHAACRLSGASTVTWNRYPDGRWQRLSLSVSTHPMRVGDCALALASGGKRTHSPPWGESAHPEAGARHGGGKPAPFHAGGRASWARESTPCVVGGSLLTR